MEGEPLVVLHVALTKQVFIHSVPIQIENNHTILFSQITWLWYLISRYRVP